jgi:predicted RNA-binding Zn-ribbon protein involved in translation (DUF1610 family)
VALLEDCVIYETPEEKCPHCGVELRGDRIPEDRREAYGQTHFGRKIAIYSLEQDRTTHYICPDCRGVIPRR